MDDKDYLIESMINDFEVEELEEAGDGAAIIEKIRQMVSSISQFISNTWTKFKQKVDSIPAMRSQARQTDAKIKNSKHKIDSQIKNMKEADISILQRIYRTVSQLCGNIRQLFQNIVARFKGKSLSSIAEFIL